MASNHEHHQHAQHDMPTPTSPSASEPGENWRLAFSATVHCLVGCGIGEVVGVVIGTALHMTMLNTMILGIVLGFIAGFALGLYPLRKAGFGWRWSVKQVLVAEGISIAVMEAFEVMTQVYLPGVMEAGLGDWLFWAGMLAALVVGFVAAFPVNLFLVLRGIRHRH